MINMAKFEVNDRFRDKETKEIYEVGTVLDWTVKRAKEATDKLGDHLLTRLDKPEDKKPADEDVETAEETEETEDKKD